MLVGERIVPLCGVRGLDLLCDKHGFGVSLCVVVQV